MTEPHTITKTRTSERLADFQHSTEHEPDGTLSHQWALPAVVPPYEHYLNYDETNGWTISPWAPDDVMHPTQFQAWQAQIELLHTAYEELSRHSTPAHGRINAETVAP